MTLNALRETYLDQPCEVSIETLAQCNAACTFCPYPTLERKGVRMPDAHIYHLLEQMMDWQHPFSISPFKVNEPLLDNRLMAICQIIDRKVNQASVRLFTNGSPLTIKHIQDIEQLQRVEHLWISLNSYDPVEYQRIMGIPFARTARNLDVLHVRVCEQRFPHPVVVSKVTANPHSLEDQGFRRYCMDRWPAFAVQLIKQDGWLGYVPPSSPLIPDSPCARWFELSILATGKISLCCMDGEGAYPIGDTHTSSLLDIYNAPHWRDRRERMLSRREIHPCSTCTY